MQIPIQMNLNNQNHVDPTDDQTLWTLQSHFIRVPDSPQQGSNPLNFIWLPPMPSPVTGVIYDFKIFSVLPGQNIQEAMQSGIPVYEQKEIGTTTLNADLFV